MVFAGIHLQINMKDAITVQDLTRDFIIYKREAGIWASIKSLFKREAKTKRAVNSISFSIRQGEFVGFVGPNGAGKTTTLKMLSGILHPTSGTAKVLGYIPWERKQNFQKSFSLVMGQKNQMWWDLPVIESFEFNKTVYEIPDFIYESQKKTLITLLGIEEVINQPVRKLSLGERMKCELACALLHKPDVLFLDEPTIGLDVVSQKNIRDFLRNYNQETGATIILTSHYMEDIKRLCKRVVIINDGIIIYDGDIQKLTEKFTHSKVVAVALNGPLSLELLKDYGKPLEVRSEYVRILVKRERIKDVAQALIGNPAVEDITIHDKSLEDIIGELFSTPHA